ncbi:putative chromosome 2-partitioning protein ParB [Deinococcus malanensis]|uniref:Chromosome 2-partitioning protein ParB n=1 Tax=Deinococcus malanensis TaxID=1706855 RepID=A0ABQ2EYZ5_9DEIO|nr:ParB/RepB/Spo0J family partition protein [Deinococcus malanensis]GGK34287.1 putative chromosome 2-partitioning protein ParB [Deinococcus malanensis]
MAKGKRPPVSAGFDDTISRVQSAAVPVEVGVRDLTPLPGQPRRTFDAAALEELAHSIRRSGVLQPLVTRRTASGTYEIVAGERRWRAAVLAGLATVPVTVRTLTDREALEVAITENLQRADLNPVDRVDATVRLIALELDLDPGEVSAHLNALRKRPDDAGHADDIAKLEALFRHVGGTWPTFLSHHLPILRFPSDVLDAMRTGGLEYTKGRVIARVADEDARARLLAMARDGASLDELTRAATPARVPSGERAARIQRVRSALARPRTLEALSSRQQQQVDRLLRQLDELLTGTATTDA